MHFAFKTLAVSVDSDQRPDLHWLAEFMGPTCRVCAGGRVLSHSVRLRADAALHAEYSARLASGAAHGRAIGFVMDSGTVDLPMLHEGATRIAHDPAFGVFYRIVTPHWVDIIDAPHPDGAAPRRARGALMRIVREWVTNSARRAGHLAVHAAGIARDGQAILFAGSKNSGKTTLMAACLLRGDRWGLLANDRILIDRGEHGWMGRGIASIVSVRAGTAEHLPAVQGRFEQRTGRAFVARGEAAGDPYLVDGRMSLSPQHLADALGAGLTGEVTLGAIAFPTVDSRADGIITRPMGPKESTDRLASSLFAAATPQLESELFEAPGQAPLPSADAVLAQVAAVASATRCMEVRLGLSAYASDRVAALLGALCG